MRRPALIFLTLTIACSRETPAPPATTSTTPVTTTTAPPATTTQIPQLEKGTYDEALLWLRSTHGFHFVLDEGSVHAEGEMKRATPGAEKVQFRVKNDEWLAEASAQGVTWKRRSGGKWAQATQPEYGNRVYQRVTFAFDPQKKEGVPLLVSREGETNLYRFTNANTGEVHEVWVRKSDAHIERMKIGETMELKIAP